MINAIAITMSEYFFFIPLVVGGVYFLLQNREVKKNMLILSVVALQLTVLLMFVLNSVYQNPRPDIVLHFSPFFANHFASNGFPSSHTTLMTLIAGVLYVSNKKIGIFLFIVTLLSAFSRVYLGLHHTVDIIAGIFLAIVVTAISQYIINRLIFSRSQ